MRAIDRDGLVRRLQVPAPDGELAPTALISHDVKPIERARQTWGSPAFLGLWATISFNINNFQLGSSLLVVGLSWWQVIIATLVGHALAACLIVLASYPGLYYKISFPVSMRMAWGFIGTIFVVFNRILLSIIWFGVNAWQGGLVTYVCLRAIWPSIDKIHNTIPASEGMTLPQFVSFIVFYVLMLPFLYLPPQYLKYVVYTTSLAAFVAQLGLVGWACGTAENLSAALKASSPPAPSGQLGWLFLYGISTTMSSITSGTLSICDYTRFAKEPQSGIWSQLVGAVPAWISNVFGLLTIAATSTRYRAAQWSVPTLLGAVQDADNSPRTRAAVFFCAFAFFANQIALNIIGNSFSGGTDMASLLPRWINIRRGQYLIAVLGLATNPWRLLSSAGVFLTVISGYTVFVQPFIGILVGYYFIVYKQRVLIEHLYRVGKDSSIYWYFHGVNWRAIFAWLVGVVPHLPGFLHAVSPTIWVSNGAAHLYQLTSITSFLFAFLTTVLLGYLFPVKSQAEYVQSSDRDTSVLRSAQFADQMYYTPGLEIRKEVSRGSDQDEEKLAGMRIEGEAFKVRLSAEMA